MGNSRNILFVSHEAPDEETRRLLESRELRLIKVNDLKVAADFVSQTKFDAVVLDLKIDPDAVTFVRSIRSQLPVLVIGEWGSGQPSVALSAGADGYEPAPLDGERLLASIERLLTKRGLAAVGNE